MLKILEGKKSHLKDMKFGIVWALAQFGTNSSQKQNGNGK